MAANDYSQVGRSLGTAVGNFFGDGNSPARRSGEMAGLQQAHLQSTIALQQAKAKADQEALDQASPEATLTRTAIANGVPADLVPTLGAYFKTGKLPYAAPDGRGMLMEEPAGLTPQVLTTIGKQFADARMMQGGDAKSLNDIAQARGTNQETTALGSALAGNDLVRYSQLQNKDPVKQVQSLIAQGILKGETSPAAGGKQIAATDGKPLYSQNGEGSVLDVFGGGVDQTNPLALTTLGLRKAQTGSQNASAASSYASANASNARAAQTKQDTALGAKGTYDPNRGIIVDPRTGEARQVTLDGDAIGAKADKLKDIPATVNAKIIDGQQGVSNIDQAIESVRKNPKAFGISNAVPGMEKLKQLGGDQGAIEARGKVANIGSITLHDRSGAAVSASEFPRLAPFIPSPSDSAATVITKLTNMKRIAEDELGLFSETYGEGSGYKPSPILARRKAAAAATEKPAAQINEVKTDADYNSLPSGTRFRAPDGTVRVKP